MLYSAHEGTRSPASRIAWERPPSVVKKAALPADSTTVSGGPRAGGETEVDFPQMKKQLAVLSIAVSLFASSLLAVSATPVDAATPRVTSSVVPAASGTSGIGFAGDVSLAGQVKVTIFRGASRIRVITASVTGSRYAASWDLKDAQGAAVAPGRYSYAVSAVGSGGTAVARGRLRVPAARRPAVTAPPLGRWVGFYHAGNGESMDALTALESQVATHAAVFNLFVSDAAEGFPTNRTRDISARGSIPMVTLEFWSAKTGGAAAIAGGSRDAYLNTFADAAKAHGGEVWLRPFHEMNSNWYPWAGAYSGNSPAQVVAAWKHVKQLFAARGATNVKFVWCVNNESVPNTAANAIGAYWPGDAYVDYLAIDGYNFGTSATWSTWRSFGSLIGSSYGALTALSTKPLFLAETGCVEQGGKKHEWIADMFKSITTSFPRITGVCWFNVNDTTANTDWRVDSCPDCLAAFKAVVAAGF
jgi:hypothetical protein